MSEGARAVYAVTMVNGVHAKRRKVSLTSVGILDTEVILTRPKGTTGAVGYAVNAHGEVAGEAWKAGAGNICYWSANGATSLLGSQEASCINDNGLVGAWRNAAKYQGGALWNHSTGKWQNSLIGWPLDINNSGTVVTHEGIQWIDGSYELLNGANGLSESGLIAYSQRGIAYIAEATANGINLTQLATYPSGLVRDGRELPATHAVDVNDARQVVGFCSRSWVENGMSMMERRATLFEDGTTSFLEDVVAPSDLVLEMALSINEAGWIACRGYRNGAEIAVLLIPNN